MKNILSALLVLTITVKAFTAPVNMLVQNNGNWNSAAAWSLNRVPVHNDTLIVPAGFSLVISNNISLNNLYIVVSGKMKFVNGKLNLDKFSDIYVLIGGIITGGGNNDKINIGNSEVFRGSEPAVVGPAFADMSTGSGFASFALLPVKFLSFTAKKMATTTELKWSTSEESGNSHFEVQYSKDGNSWITAGIVGATANPTAINQYSFLHSNPSEKTAYYRIKQVDNSTHVSYSNVQVVHTTTIETNAEVFAVSKHVIAVKLNGVQRPATIKIYNQSGRLILQRVENTNQVRINVSSTATDIYVVQVMIDGRLISAKKLMM